MEYEVGQRLKWTPTYFKWDQSAEVEVLRVYRNGHALLSNNKIADEDGSVRWYGKIGGTVELLLSAVEREHTASKDCWCKPEAGYVDPDTGVTVWIHRGLQ